MIISLGQKLRLSRVKIGENTVFALESYRNEVEVSSIFSYLLLSFCSLPLLLNFFDHYFFSCILRCAGASRRGVLDQYLGIGEPLSV